VRLRVGSHPPRPGSAFQMPMHRAMIKKKGRECLLVREPTRAALGSFSSTPQHGVALVIVSRPLGGLNG